jgi:hypothetical protein
MSTATSSAGQLICPLCRREFDLGTEEYCTHDGERLLFVPPMAPVESSDSVPPPAKVPPQAQTTSAADVPEAEADLSGVEKLFARFGIRRKREAAAPSAFSAASDDAAAQESPTQAAQAPAGEATPDDTDDPLPESLKEAGWQIAGTLSSDEFADIWPVERAGVPARFTRYRGRVLTPAALYRQLRQTQCPALPAVLDAGTANLRGHAQASYDLCTISAAAGPLQRLDDWMRQSPPSEAKALALLPALVEMLETIHTAGVAPITLHPSHLLRHDSGRLQLSHVAALTVACTDAAPADYRPELDRNPLVSRLWSAPELAEQLVVHAATSCVFSVGQILAASLWGQPQDLAALRAGQVPLQAIADARLARVLQGCLWPHHMEGRWSHGTLSQTVNAPLTELPPAEDWARLGPQAMACAFALNGRSYWRVEDLVAATVQPENWTQAAGQVDAMLDWIEAGSPWASVVPPLRGLMAAGRSADHALVQMALQIRGDLPLTWRSLNLEDASARSSLVHLGQRNLAGDVTPEEIALLQALFSADLRGAFVRQ